MEGNGCFSFFVCVCVVLMRRQKERAAGVSAERSASHLKGRAREQSLLLLIFSDENKV